jgi:hypothetical protein
VSPLWRDEIGIHLSPSRVLMIRLGRGLEPVMREHHEHAIVCGDWNDWTAPLGVLDQLLERPQWRSAGARLVLSDCWVRYALVPWAPALMSADEQLSHARQVLIRLYGNAVGEWEIRLSQAPPGRSRLACAMPAALHNWIRDIRTRHRLALISLQPQLLVAYENWRHRLPAAGAWFVTIGDGTLTAARLGCETWDRVHSVRIGEEWARDLKRLQTFGRLASSSQEEGQVYVNAPTAWRELAGPAAKDICWLEEESRSTGTLQQLERLWRSAA